MKKRYFFFSVIILFLILGSGCIRSGEQINRYESLVWTNEWIQLRKREVALPLEIRKIKLSFDIHHSLENWKYTIEDFLIQNLLRLHRIVEEENPEAEIVISLLPIRGQLMGSNAIVYEIRGNFTVLIGNTLFRSNVTIFDRVYANTQYPTEKVYQFLISRWTHYVSEDIHYGWSISQDFSTIPWLGGTNETDVSTPWPK